MLTYFFLALSCGLMCFVFGTAWIARGFQCYPGQKQFGVLAWVFYVLATLSMFMVAGVSIYVAATLIFMVSAVGYFEPEIESFLVRRSKDPGIAPVAPKAPIK